MADDLICRRVELCRQGKNPHLIHAFRQSYFVVGDHQFRGYSLLLLLKRHVRELHELSLQESREFSDELRLAGRAIAQTFQPWKMNYLCLGNQEEHVHWHILPRYEEDPNHRTFPMTEYIKGQIHLADYRISDEQAGIAASQIRQVLQTLL